MQVVLDNLDSFVEGIRLTVGLTLLAFLLAFLIGTLVAAFRVSPVPPLRAAGAFWVETVRNTPLSVQLIIFYFGFTKLGVRESAFTSGVIVLGVYTSAFLAETIRSGINTVARGQAEAARAIGLTFPQILRIVVLPQALRSVIGPVGNIFIALIKNSAAVGGFLSVGELFRNAQLLQNETAQPVAVFFGTAIAYLLLTIPSGRGFSFLEHRLAVRR